MVVVCKEACKHTATHAHVARARTHRPVLHQIILQQLAAHDGIGLKRQHFPLGMLQQRRAHALEVSADIGTDVNETASGRRVHETRVEIEELGGALLPPALVLTLGIEGCRFSSCDGEEVLQFCSG